MSSSSSLISLSSCSLSFNIPTKSLQHLFDEFCFFACHAMASSWNLSKSGVVNIWSLWSLSGVVNILPSFTWAHLHFLATSTAFLVFSEGWEAMACTIACCKPFWGVSGPAAIAVFSSPSASFSTYVIHFSTLTVFLPCGHSPDCLKPCIKWEEVLLSLRIFKIVGRDPFSTACIQVSW